MSKKKRRNKESKTHGLERKKETEEESGDIFLLDLMPSDGIP